MKDGDTVELSLSDEMLLEARDEIRKLKKKVEAMEELQKTSTQLILMLIDDLKEVGIIEGE